MAHHQNHGHLDHMKRPTSIQGNPSSSTVPSMSEDEHAAEVDEPPEQNFAFPKSTPTTPGAKQSLLTKALHTDSESHDDESLGFRRQTSRSSNASTHSGRSDFTSDDGHMSSGTRGSTPGSPHTSFFKHGFSLRPKAPSDADDTQLESKPTDTSHQSSQKSSEPVVEAELGRKRCISFACGSRQQSISTEKPPAAKQQPDKQPEPKKRACLIRFACPSKNTGQNGDGEDPPPRRPSRHLSPPPKPSSHSPSHSPSPACSPVPARTRAHRDSDTTVKNESPRVSRKSPQARQVKTESIDPDYERAEAQEFHEFACKDEKVENWVQESTCHKSRLTIGDTLKKENDIRQLGDEAEEEALEEEDAEDNFSGDESGEDSDSDLDISDGGFQTDDEEGFAESDDDGDDDSDYEWWTPRRAAPQMATMAPGDTLRPPAMRSDSISSMSSVVSATRQGLSSRPKSRKGSQAIAIRPPSPSLPDSTDFVCGTLDEDKPLEEAYVSALEQHRASKRRPTPQDIDPTFPTDIDTDEEDDDDVSNGGADSSDHTQLLHGSLENLHHEEGRGRKRFTDRRPSPKRSPIRPRSPAPPTQGLKRMPSHRSPNRPRSPPPPTQGLKRMPSHRSPAPPTVASRQRSPAPPTTTKRRRSPAPSALAIQRSEVYKSPPPVSLKRGQVLRSPPPRALFGHSPHRVQSPISADRIPSPPPSSKGTPPGFGPVPFGTSFLGQRPQLTHTTSLPRSPNPFARRRNPFEMRPSFDTSGSETPPLAHENDESDDGEDTARENKPTYKRGAIDIVQGLERKRLRRRQRFFEKYQQKQEKKRERGENLRKPQPGKGAERMRQVGIECAIYKGRRVLSL